jgi:hypothetical protein
MGARERIPVSQPQHRSLIWERIQVELCSGHAPRLSSLILHTCIN